MVQALDDACNQSQDPVDAPPLVVTWEAQSGRPGRPRKEVDPQFLAFALDLRGPKEVGEALGLNPRTVSRRAVEYGIRDPGVPVFQNVDHPDGTSSRIHQSSTAPVSTLSDQDLDAVVAHILESFPHFGRSMLSGQLRAMGHRVPRERLRQSFIRVHGVSGVFGGRAIHRRKYQVPGANSVWHHDGQHGMFLNI